ncbi:MAG: CsgG/HfaB family protein [Candidatus Eisenbacteria bacterium]|nr:CsgG/HfaB family protein [Candidatus Eisenbacteria bacterium]
MCLRGGSLLFLALTLFSSYPSWAGGRWYDFYNDGLRMMKEENWQGAIAEFTKAVAVESNDAQKIRTYGVNFVEYFPHREMGICYFNLGDFQNAISELERSMKTVFSARAREYLEKAKAASGGAGQAVTAPPKVIPQETQVPSQGPSITITKPLENETMATSKLTVQGFAVDGNSVTSVTVNGIPVKVLQGKRVDFSQDVALRPGENTITVSSANSRGVSSTKSVMVRIAEEKARKVGSKLSVAVLPFEAKGGAQTLGEMVLDKLTTSLVNLQRFNVMERSKLEELLKEQKLGMTGVIDASTAAQVGKNIGVEGIFLGSVSLSGNLASIDARLIDTASGSILSARDVSSSTSTIENVKKMVDDLVQKVANDIPILAGTVIQVEGDLVYLDIGSNRGTRKGMKFVIYREGEPIKHPVTGEVLGTKIEELGDVAITEPMDRMCAALVVRRIGGTIEVGSKAITK